MNPEVKAKWLAALRSGEYKQGHDRLRNKHNDTFCCLGVLCALHAKEGLGKWVRNNDPRIMSVAYQGEDHYDTSALHLPYSVRDWAGVSPIGLRIEAGSEKPDISAFNDGSPNNGIKKHSFAEIADLIEEYF